MNGLIGHTGFVGSNLANQFNFDCLFNSKNISDIANKNFNVLVCAAAPGSMIEANKNKDHDKKNIDLLIDNISKSRPNKVVLISTIAVFKDFSADNDESSEKFETELSYGLHRRYLEKSLEDICNKIYIIRLPSLFGEGLKKNFIFDLINQVPSFFNTKKFNLLNSLIKHEGLELSSFYEYNSSKDLYTLNRDKYNTSPASIKYELISFLNNAESSALYFHSHKSTYQFYNLNNLSLDIIKVINNDINIMHLNSEPI
ncbi:hypothetical protein N8Z60_03480, partial [Gammaproteobacteria bacterium]|nr:hypothetical protein [Gammaproteobacteria bacterium]